MRLAMQTKEFAEKFLPQGYGERDLQLLIQRRIRRWGFLRGPDEVKIKTRSTVRRSDLETWCTRYEIKRELDYSSLKSALGQLYLYNHYGSKILGFIPKKKVIIGLAPHDEQERQSALKLAVDIEGIGVRVIFLNEFPNWRESTVSASQIKVVVLVLIFVIVFGLSLLLSSL
jgi:hypothetical protein